jgi:TP901 family phage tail tape measure protein
LANDHVIDVKVRADTTGLSKGLSDAEKDLGKAGTGFSKYGSEAEKASKQTQGFVEKNRGHMETVGKDAMIMGAGILAGVAVAVHAYSEFAGRMAQVQSLSHASAAEMDVLSKSAMTMGSAFGLSANDVADAEIELVKAGVSVKEMIGGALPGALALAAAGQIDVGKATEIATIALTQFNLTGKDVPHVADLLAAGADKALGGVSELGDGLKQGGLIASQFGLTIDDTVGTLSAFANAGLLGSDAGTSMKTMFLALASPSKQAQKALDEYKISAYDSKGAFIGVTALAGQLHDKLGPLSDAQRNAALSTIFGTDAMRSASVLMKEGSTGIQKWITDVNDQGFAAAQAAGKLNSLNGDFKKLQAAFETGLIQMGATANGFLRPVVQGVTDAVSAFNGLPEGAKAAGMAVAGVTGAGLLLGGMLLTAVPKVYDTVQAFKALEQASPRLAEGIKGVGKASLITAGLLIALKVAQTIGQSFETSAKSTDEMAQSLLKLQVTGAKTNEVFGKDSFASSNGRKFVDDVQDIGAALKQVTGPDAIDNINDFGNTVLGVLSFGNLHKDTQLDKTRESIKNIDAAMANFANSGSTTMAAENFHKIATSASQQGVTLENTAKAFPQYMNSLRKLATDMKVPLTDQELLNLAVGRVPQIMKDAQNSTEGQAKIAELAAKKTEEQAKALDDLGLAADGSIEHLDRLVQSMQAAGLISISADQAAINYQKSLEAVDAAVIKNGKNLDITTAAGKENKEAWLGQASAADAATQANAKNGMSSADLQVKLTDQYYKLRDNAIAFGAGATEADDMARAALGIPKGVKIETAIQNYADAMAKLQGVKQAVDAIRDYKEVSIHVQYTESGTAIRDRAGDAGMSNMVQAYASGGAIYGAGAKGVDSVRAVLAPGEHVLSDDDVDAMGGQDAVYAFRKQLHNGAARPLYAAPAPPAPAAMGGFSQAGPVAMTGTLVLDSGELMGTFSGIAHQVTDAKLSQVSRQVGGMRR